MSINLLISGSTRNLDSKFCLTLRCRLGDLTSWKKDCESSLNTLFAPDTKTWNNVATLAQWCTLSHIGSLWYTLVLFDHYYLCIIIYELGCQTTFCVASCLKCKFCYVVWMQLSPLITRSLLPEPKTLDFSVCLLTPLTIINQKSLL